jgi:hypothetical protein
MKTLWIALLLTGLTARAETHSRTRHSRGNWEQTDTGWTWVADHTWNNGRTAATTGSGTRTESGRQWSSQTAGTTPHGVGFNGSASGNAVKNGDGTVTVTREW